MDLVCEMDVSQYYSHTLSVGSTQVGIIKQVCQVFGSLLQCLDGANLEAQVLCPMCLGNFAHQACERSLMDEEFSTLLVPTHLTDSHCTWLVPQHPLKSTLPEFFVRCEDLNNLPTISNPLSCLSLLANSSGDSGVLPEGVSSWVTLLPTLSITCILAIMEQ